MDFEKLCRSFINYIPKETFQEKLKNANLSDEDIQSLIERLGIYGDNKNRSQQVTDGGT